jgi:Ca-activated chloride channel family protein
MTALVAACGGGATTTAAPTTTVAPTTTAAPSTTAAAPATTQPPSQGDATLEFTSEVVGGTQFEVSWTGPDNDRDFVTVVDVGAAAGAFRSYFYTDDGPVGALIAPIDPGAYEVRYVDGASNATVATASLTVVAGEVSLESPEQVEAGTEFDVTWTKSSGDGPRDFVTIVAAGADKGAFNSYFYTAAGATGTLTALVAAGDYEVRYVNGSENETLAAVPLVVTPSQATVDPPDQVNAGADFQVSWTGPNLDRDYITIVAKGSPVGTYNDYAYTSEGNPVTIAAPDTPGDYEVWYASDRIQGVFATTPIVVK